MKALLLNSGIGKRMGDLTRDMPKCLVEVYDQETILYRQVKALIENGIEEIIITTGPFEEKIKKYLDEAFPGLRFHYVLNPLYESTNYIYSMLLAKDFMDDDIILMHGDLVFEEILLEKTIQSSYANTVLVNPQASLPEKDFKARVENGRVKEISIHIFDDNCFFLIPLYKLSRELCEKWLAEIEEFKKQGKLSVYAEDALNNILKEQSLYPIYFNRELCSEIDDVGDLETVRNLMASQAGGSRLCP